MDDSTASLTEPEPAPQPLPVAQPWPTSQPGYLATAPDGTWSPPHGAVNTIEVLVRPRPTASRHGWIVALVAMLGFVVCGETIFAGLAGVLFVAALSAALVGSGTIKRRREPIGWLVGALMISVGLILRASPWLVVLNILAIGSLLVAAALTATSGSLFRLTRPSFVEGMARAVGGWLTGLTLIGPACAWLVSTDRRWRRSAKRRENELTEGERPDGEGSEALAGGRLWRSLLLALPVLLVVVPLLRAGDAVFNRVIAKAFTFPIDALQNLRVTGGQVVNATIGLWLGLALLGIAGTRYRERRTVERVWTPVYAGSHTTTNVASNGANPTRIALRVRLAQDVIGACWMLNAVLGLFAIGQVANVLGMTSRLEREVVSYREIAKEGFFPLLMACAVVLLSLICVHTVLRERRWEKNARRALQSTILLTLFVIAVASRRLWVGADVWGLTMLRVMAQSGAVVLAVVFGCLALWQRAATDRLPVVGVTAAASVLLLFTLNVIPIEAIIVRWNSNRPSAEKASSFDPRTMEALDPKWGQSLGVATCESYYNKWHGRNVDGVLALGPIVTKQVQLKRLDPLCAFELLGCDHAFRTDGLRWNRARAQATKQKKAWCGSLGL